MPKIHAIETGQVRCRQRMVRGIAGPLRRAALITGPWTEWLPILAWAIEHDEGVLLVDTGEHEAVRDAPFAQFRVTEQDHLAVKLRALGIEPPVVRTVVFTHLHGDHMNGFEDLPSASVVLSAAEWQHAQSPIGRLTQRLTHQPLPERLNPTTVTFDGPAVGAFDCSHALTPGGDVVLVPTPGHTPGHSSVLVTGEEHDVLLLGDAAYTQQQLLDRHPDAVSPKASVARRTMDTVLRHCAERPTVVLPSHDPESQARLAAGTVCAPA